MALYTRGIKSAVGNFTLIANDNALLSLEFKFSKKNDTSQILDQAEKELTHYFAGELKIFKTPLAPKGTEFQKKCWKQLQMIHYGKTISYKEQAIKIAGPTYTRAVAGANNKNPLPIIIPCHRVIGSDGSLVGYAGGLELKEKLLNIELKSL